MTGFKKFLKNFYFEIRVALQRMKIGNYHYSENDPKTFPIIIISFNQLKYLKRLIKFLQEKGYRNLVIIDNASTYLPLINYLEQIKKNVFVHKLKKNHGHMVFWLREDLYKIYAKGYYAVTDADIVPDDNCPDDFLGYFKEILEKDPNLTKVGFSLRIDNIPDYVPYKEKIINWEKRFWENKLLDGNFKAAIDTTFALYRPREYKKSTSNFFNAIRTKKPYTAIHGGWYVNPDNLTKEQKFYFEKVNKSSSWRLNKNGELDNPELK